jgi:hypothetical protein
MLVGLRRGPASTETFVDQLQAWLESALQDAERRQLPALRPLLEGLSRSTSVLREADWNLEATDRSEQSSEHER